MWRQYCLYGVNLESQFAFPYARGRRRGYESIELRRATRPFAKNPLPAAAASSAWFQHSTDADGNAFLRWPKLFEFKIAADGSSVEARRLAGSSEETLHSYLLGQALSFALLNRGIEQWHASVTVHDGEALVLLGDSGMGKSTLAAALIQAGGQLLTDDMLVMRSGGGRVMGFPGPPRLKLMPEAARSTIGLPRRRRRMHPRVKKLLLPLESNGSFGAVPVRRIYVLARGRQIEMRTLSERQACLALVGNAFNIAVRDPGRLGGQLRSAATIAQGVRVKQLKYPRDLRQLARVSEAVLSDFRRG